MFEMKPKLSNAKKLSVYKFGGTSISSAEKILDVARIVCSCGNRVVVVCSALDGITEKLIEVCRRISLGKEVTNILNSIYKKHVNIIEKALSRQNREAPLREIDKVYKKLEQICSNAIFLKEVTPKMNDFIIGSGEMLSSPILASCIIEQNKESVYLTGGEAGIITDSNFGNAVPLFELTYHLLRKRLTPILEQGKIPVVSGFNAYTQHGEISILGRGGSDFTASLIGAALRVDEIVIWSDVDGLMTADPRVVEEASVIRELTYSEAKEMAMFGAKFMHPRFLDPAEKFGIIVKFKNTFNPSCDGTVVKSKTQRKGPVTSVALVKDVSSVTIKSTSIVGKPGSAASIFTEVAKTGTNIMMISQSISESNISFVVKRNDGRKAARALEKTLMPSGEIADISVEENLSVVAVIGENMKGTPGIAAKIFTALGQEGINVKMIAQGSSEMNISFVVDKKDSIRAVKVIHTTFGLNNLGKTV